jgi:biopolymer transport protein ExbD
MRATRQQHQLPHVDMTSFVSIAMLLITFFVWIKQIERNKVVAIYASTNGKAEYYQPVTASLFLLKNDRVGYLQVKANGRADYSESACSVGELGAIVRSIALFAKPTLVIKPTAQCRIKNLIHVIDALMVDGRVTYVLAYQFAREEQQLLAMYRRYKQTNPQRTVMMSWPLY